MSKKGSKKAFKVEMHVDPKEIKELKDEVSNLRERVAANMEDRDTYLAEVNRQRSELQEKEEDLQIATPLVYEYMHYARSILRAEQAVNDRDERRERLRVKSDSIINFVNKHLKLDDRFTSKDGGEGQMNEALKKQTLDRLEKKLRTGE